MDARAVSIKNDPQAKPGQEVGGLYWYPTKYGTGHTGFVYSWDKKNSDKFTGLDGNYTDKVRFVSRRKSDHAKYISNPYPQSESSTPVTIKKKDRPKPPPEIAEIPEEIALQIDAGNVTIDHGDYFRNRLKIIGLLCIITFVISMANARFKKDNKTVTL